MGFTHLELLPVNEHPFDGSWGYQPTGLYAPTRRFGTRDDFRYFVDAAHAAGLNVILTGCRATSRRMILRWPSSTAQNCTSTATRAKAITDWNTLITTTVVVKSRTTGRERALLDRAFRH